MDGATATAPTDRSFNPSVRGTQVAPPSVVFQTPAAGGPDVRGPGRVGWNAIAVIRPAPLVGPERDPLEPPIPAGRLSAAASLSRQRSYSAATRRSPLLRIDPPAIAVPLEVDADPLRGSESGLSSSVFGRDGQPPRSASTVRLVGAARSDGHSPATRSRRAKRDGG